MKRFASVATAVLLAAALAPCASSNVLPRSAACGSWRRVPVPAALRSSSGTLSDVAVVSADDVWAVGDLGVEQPVASLILHWNGTRWVRTPLAKVAQLTGVTAGPSDAWAVGYRGGLGPPSRPFTARWNGDRWRSVATIEGLHGWLEDVTAVPGTRQVWAVGGGANGRPLALHWTGSAWRRIPTPVTSGHLSGIVAFHRTAWAVGYSRHRFLSLRWDGRAWRRIGGPRGSGVSIDGRAPASLWATGTLPTASGEQRAAIFHLRDGAWRRVWTGGTRTYLSGVVTPSPGTVWAVGSRTRTPPYDPVIVRREGGDWHATTLPGADGWIGAIDGRPDGLWITHRWMTDPHGSEPTYFDTYRRC